MTTGLTLPAADATPRPRRHALATPSLIVGGLLFAVALGAGLLSLVWTPHDVAAIDVARQLQPPSARHWLGTDTLGRDELSLLLVGAWHSLSVSMVAVGLGAGLGCPLGLWAGVRGGGVDGLLMRVNDIVFAFPALLLAILLTAAFGPGTFNAMRAIGVFNVPVFARVTRSAALSQWQREYVLAARLAGKGALRIAFEHVLPNILPLLVVQATLQFSLGVIAEAGLSYLGLGSPPPAVSWGRMLADAQTLTAVAPWLAVLPGAAIVGTVLGLNLLGDGLRDRLAPRASGARVPTPAAAVPAADARDAAGGDAPGAALLRVRDLSVTLGGRPLLQGLSFTLEAGEVLAVVGESGAGKSMLALALAQLLPPGAALHGSVRLGGRELVGLAEPGLCALRGRDIGLVFQEPMTALNPLMTVGDQVAETVRRHRRVGHGAARALAQHALAGAGYPVEQLGLARYPHQLSGGQRQRVATALASVLSPMLLIADEATTALDTVTQHELLHTLRRLTRERGSGLLLISHDLAAVAAVADRVLVLHTGRLVEGGPVEAVLREPQQAYTRQLLRDARHRPQRPPSHAAGPPVLEADRITRTYRTRLGPDAGAERLAVGSVSLSIGRGEAVGLVGASGSGKSSLLRVLLALDAPQAGRVRLVGEPFAPRAGAAGRHLRRQVQAVFQDPYGSFDPHWSVERLVAEPLAVLPPSERPADLRATVGALLERVGLRAADRDRRAHEFSGGQRQRIALARALITRPALVVLDEAVSALDGSVRARILDLLAGLQRDDGLAWLFVSHDLRVVRAMTDRVLVMDAGHIVEQGSTAQVLGAPRHAATRRLVDAEADLDAWLDGDRQPPPAASLSSA